jgi:hypothetical protein
MATVSRGEGIFTHLARDYRPRELGTMMPCTADTDFHMLATDSYDRVTAGTNQQDNE